MTKEREVTIMNWSYFDKFEVLTGKYLPDFGEGDNMATQVTTAVCKLVYKWYNDGDVYDNVHSGMRGWANNISSYANWLHAYTTAGDVLERIFGCFYDNEYEDILAALADALLTSEALEAYAKCDKTGSVYQCDGPFAFEESGYEEEEE